MNGFFRTTELRSGPGPDWTPGPVHSLAGPGPGHLGPPGPGPALGQSTSVLVLVQLDLVVVELVKPSKADEVDGRDADVSFDEELGDLGTNVSPEIRTL